MDKLELRREFISLRDGFDEEYKSFSDKKITELLITSTEYTESKEIFIYVSVRSEVDTSAIISQAFGDGKKVAVPYCRNGLMNFYYISSVDELKHIQFGVPTVDIDTAVLAVPSSDTLCVVPALSFDKDGNRLGYGGGYYDRYLAANAVKSVGLCREKSLTDCLPAEEFDVKIDNIITERAFSRRRF